MDVGGTLLSLTDLAHVYHVCISSARELITSLTEGWVHQKLLLDVLDRRLKCKVTHERGCVWRLQVKTANGELKDLVCDSQLQELLSSRTKDLALLSHRLMGATHNGVGPGVRGEELTRIHVWKDLQYWPKLGSGSLGREGCETFHFLGLVGMAVLVEKPESTRPWRYGLLPAQLSAAVVIYIVVFRPPSFILLGSPPKEGDYVFTKAAAKSGADIINAQLAWALDSSVTIQMWRRFHARVATAMPRLRGWDEQLMGLGQARKEKGDQSLVAGAFGHSAHSHTSSYVGFTTIGGVRVSPEERSKDIEVGCALSTLWHTEVMGLARPDVLQRLTTVETGGSDIDGTTGLSSADRPLCSVVGSTSEEIDSWLDSTEGLAALRRCLGLEADEGGVGREVAWREGQKQAVSNQLLGVSQICALPVGSGKSATITFEASVRRMHGLRRRLAVVITPYLCLFNSHVLDFQKAGLEVRVVCGSGQGELEKLRIRRGEAADLLLGWSRERLGDMPDVLLITPESLLRPDVLTGLGWLGQGARISAIFVDEAQEWASPCYRSSLWMTSWLHLYCPSVPTTGLTGSLHGGECAGLAELLGLGTCYEVVEAGCNFANVECSLVLGKDESECYQEVVGILTAHLDEVEAERMCHMYVGGDAQALPWHPFVLFVFSREESEQMAGRLSASLGREIPFLHAGVTAARRDELTAGLTEGGLCGVVSTSVLKCGFNSPRIKRVVVWRSQNLSDTLQMFGRAGRNRELDAHVELCWWPGKTLPRVGEGDVLLSLGGSGRGRDTSLGRRFTSSGLIQSVAEVIGPKGRRGGCLLKMRGGAGARTCLEQSPPPPHPCSSCRGCHVDVDNALFKPRGRDLRGGISGSATARQVGGTGSATSPVTRESEVVVPARITRDALVFTRIASLFSAGVAAVSCVICGLSLAACRDRRLRWHEGLAPCPELMCALGFKCGPQQQRYLTSACFKCLAPPRTCNHGNCNGIEHGQVRKLLTDAAGLNSCFLCALPGCSALAETQGGREGQSAVGRDAVALHPCVKGRDLLQPLGALLYFEKEKLAREGFFRRFPDARGHMETFRDLWTWLARVEAGSMVRHAWEAVVWWCNGGGYMEWKRARARRGL